MTRSVSREPQDPEATPRSLDDSGAFSGREAPTTGEHATGGDVPGQPSVSVQDLRRTMAEADMVTEENDYAEENLAALERLKQENRRKQKVRRQRQMMMLDHLCNNLLDVGPFEKPEHEFTAFLHRQGFFDISLVLYLTSLDDFHVAGYDIPHILYARLQAFISWYRENIEGHDVFNEALEVAGLSVDEFQRYFRKKMNEEKKMRVRAPVPAAASVTTVDDESVKVPVAGLSSRAAALNKARRESKVSFKVPQERVTVRTSTSRPSGVGGGAKPPPTPLWTPLPTGGRRVPPERPGPLPTPNPDGVGDDNDDGSAGGGGGGDPDPDPSDGSLDHGGNPNPLPYQIVFPPSSKASEFDKGSKRSSSDYEKFTNKESWNKWQRATMGMAVEHKVDNVLNPNFVPDPNDDDAVKLFEYQQRFMYSVFCKVLQEGKASDILREYSDPKKSNFGDAQSIYADLCDHFEGGAQARVSAASLETTLTTIRLNRSWSKTVRAFLNKVAHLIRDHKEATNGVQDDAYYIEKLNNTFKEHKDMSAHIQSLETQDALLTRRMGGKLIPRTYEGQLFELSEYATILDERYAQSQAARRAHQASQQKDNDRSGRGNGNGGGRGGQGGRGNGGARGRGGGRGNGNGNGNGNGRGNDQRPGPGYISPEDWRNMTPQQRQNVREERERARRTANQANGNPNEGGGGTDQNQVPPEQAPTEQVTNGRGNQAQSQPGSFLRNMMSNASNRANQAQGARGTEQTSDLTINGTTYRRVNQVDYRVSRLAPREPEERQANAENREDACNPGGLCDSGANGGVMSKENCIVIEYVENASVNLTGVGRIAVGGLPIGTTASVMKTDDEGEIIGLMPQSAIMETGESILSKGQIEHFGAIVDDRPRRNGGRQAIITGEGYTIPIHIRDGLPRIDMRKPTQEEFDMLPHVFLTSDTPWDPRVLDEEYEESFHDSLMEDPEVIARREARDPRVDNHGFLRSRDEYQVLFDAQDRFIQENSPSVFPEDDEIYFDAQCTAVKILDPYGEYSTDEPQAYVSKLERAANRLLSIFPNRLRRQFPHLDALKPYFGWASNEKIKQMLDNTTQHYRGVVHYPFRKHFKSRFPAANVPRRNEWVATDTFFCDTPAADDGIPGHAGATMMQLYLGLQSGHVCGYPMTSEKQIPETLEETIRKVGAPVGLMSDQAKAELHGRSKDLLRMYEIDDRQSEAEYQHQNPAERKIQDVKKTMNSIMDRTGCPSRWWLLAGLFTISLMNVLPNSNGLIPDSVVTAQQTDVSKFMHFHFWQEVFVESHRKGEKEELARWCYPADNVGDALTYWVLLDKSETLVTRSNVRPAKDPLFPNLRLRPQTADIRPHVETVTEDESDIAEGTATSGEPQNPGRKPIYNVQDKFDVPVHLPRFDPEELIGLSYLHELPDGQVVRAKIMKKILDRDAENHERIKLLVSYDDGKVEEVMAYNELCDLVAEQHDREAEGEQDVFMFVKILDHQGPLKKGHPNYKGSAYNVLVLWNDGSKTWEPITMMMADDPATLAAYAKDNDLLDTPGWKKLRRIAKRAQVLRRMVNASKRAQRFNEITYKFGVRIPRNVKEAIRLDEENGNTYWQDAMKKEIGQLNEYNVYHSVGKNAKVPEGYQEIPVRMVFDVKQDLTRKARLVARGDKTAPPSDSVYSGVASLRSLRIICFLAELNGLQVTGGDIGNAYLEAYTKEKVCFRAGPEFGELEGHLLIIDKALYGLRTSGARFHAKFADTLRALGFQPTYADPDVWLRDAGDCYEYVVVYVDDILSALKDPKAFYDALKADPWNYKLKNVEEPKYHLGGDFFRDKDGNLCYGAQTYVKRMIDNYKLMFGGPPREYHAPMDKDDKPELDDTAILGPDGVQKFQSLIGAVQWTISLCRMDVVHTVMSLGRFRAAPREGHLERLKKLVGYMKKRSGGAIRFRTEIPKHEEVFGYEPVRYDWMETVYGCPPEDIDPKFPKPLGNKVRTWSTCDANLMHDVVTGRSASGIQEFLNQTPIDWMGKRQSQVETATYGSEFMVARQATERLQDLRYTLRSFGVPIDGPAWLFGDNKSVVTSSTIPHSRLSKRWNALSYHKVREAIAGGWLRFEHIPGSENPADIFTKPLP
jgi:hypothetical protein